MVVLNQERIRRKFSMHLLYFDMFYELGALYFSSDYLFNYLFLWKIIKQIALGDRNSVFFQGIGQIFLVSGRIKISVFLWSQRWVELAACSPSERCGFLELRLSFL